MSYRTVRLPVRPQRSMYSSKLLSAPYSTATILVSRGCSRPQEQGPEYFAQSRIISFLPSKKQAASRAACISQSLQLLYHMFRGKATLIALPDYCKNTVLVFVTVIIVTITPLTMPAIYGFLVTLYRYRDMKFAPNNINIIGNSQRTCIAAVVQTI